jgi:hypothetical protein
MSKVVGFFIRHFGERGTEVSVYDYADCNETILNNKTIIFHFKKEKYQSLGYPYIDSAFDKFKSRFQMVEVNEFTDLNTLLGSYNVSTLYMQVAGGPEHYPFSEHINGAKFLVHCVFITTHNYGDLYVPISNYINEKCGTSYPVLPYMIRVHDTNDNLRANLGIPKESIVFGRYGGVKEFDIPFVKETVIKVAKQYTNIYFLFMNTEPFCENIPNIIFLPRQIDLYEKRKFINTCDAFLHGREGGETFGLAIGEFAICQKPIITVKGFYDNAHLDILKDDAILYSNSDDLETILTTFKPGTKNMLNNGYLQYTPESVMNIFKTLLDSF